MGCDALYWITDGDCQKQSFAAFEQTLQPRQMIVSEFWIQRDMNPMDFVPEETLVLGGIYEWREENVLVGTPDLCSIPILGKAFQSSQRRAFKSELLIFTTPRIL